MCKWLKQGIKILVILFLAYVVLSMALLVGLIIYAAAIGNTKLWDALMGI